jgi:hypothetical protein
MDDGAKATPPLDEVQMAHLDELKDRIVRVLNAQLQGLEP